MDNTIGTCSLCGGPVVLPNMMVNPVPRCQSCGATMKNPHGPVIPMERPTRAKPKDLKLGRVVAGRTG